MGAWLYCLGKQLLGKAFQLLKDKYSECSEFKPQIEVLATFDLFTIDYSFNEDMSCRRVVFLSTTTRWILCYCTWFPLEYIGNFRIEIFGMVLVTG